MWATYTGTLIILIEKSGDIGIYEEEEMTGTLL